ncbi:hypothetical protein ACFWOG_14860 [Kitasatospora sp. NPDC058406]|uniref:hypothetical protein n=1 Tax=Kitasatospora sp. NPDC058406 TaxID=3346483 RepID=UPI00364F67D5
MMVVLVGTPGTAAGAAVEDVLLVAEENPAVADLLAAVPAGAARLEDLAKHGPAPHTPAPGPDRPPVPMVTGQAGSCQMVRTTTPPGVRCSLDQARQHAALARPGQGRRHPAQTGRAGAMGAAGRRRLVMGVVMRRLRPPRHPAEPRHHPDGEPQSVPTGL